MRPQALDAIYFGGKPWARRVTEFVARRKTAGHPAAFLDGNVRLMRQLLADAESGPRMVVNIGADALLAFLASGEYKNIYEHPVVGGRRRKPTAEREAVDALLALPDAATFYFGAVALGGAGVRFYGEYCMAIRRTRIPEDARLFDRDSYDLLLQPLAGHGPTRTRRIVDSLRGQWNADLVDMLLLKALPRLPDIQHVITSGHVSGLVMSDQEFVEVHLEGKISIGDIEEIRQLPDEAAIEASILNRQRSRQSPNLVEILWAARRRKVLESLADQGVPCRVVNAAGKGYQWT